MAIVLKVAGRDLSQFVRVHDEDGLEPAPAGMIEPVFAGIPALSEGQTFVADAVGNRAWEVPLLLTAASRAALHQLITDIQNDLVRGAQVEFETDAADAASFFLLERGALDPEYQYMLSVHATARAVLTLWTRPYATTGTARTVASFGAAATPIWQFPATGLLGDRDALANLEMRVGSTVASGGRVIGYGVHRSASFRALHAATAIATSTPFVGAQASSTIVGQAAAVGSQYVAIPVSPTGASGVAYRDFLDPPGGHVGRHRIFALARSGLNRSITIYAKDRYGAVLGPTAQASVTDVGRWQLLDLGEVQVAGRASGQEAIPTQYVELYGGGASNAIINASPALHLNRLVYLPLDIAPGLMRTVGAAGGADSGGLLYSDGFDRLNLNFGDAIYDLLEEEPQADVGNVSWARVAGWAAPPGQATPFVTNWQSPGKVAPIASYGTGVYGNGPGASMFYALASGALNADVMAETKTGLTYAASPAAASAAITLWAKSQTNASTVAGGVGAKLQLGPSQFLQILGASTNGNIAILASAGIASTLASGIYLGQAHRLVLRVNGPLIDVWVATGALAASSALSASHNDALAPGWPALQMAAGSNLASAAIYADDLSLQNVAGGASDIGAREWFRFEAYPESRAVQGNASIFAFDRTAAFRGVPPRLPPAGSPGASGAPQVVAFSGDPTNFVGNDVIDIRLDAIERFRYLR